MGEGDNRFDQVVLRAAVVDADVDEFIKKIKETPDKVTPRDMLAAIRKWFATVEWIDAMTRLVNTWADGENGFYRGEVVPILRRDDEVFLWGPLNVEVRNFFVRILLGQYSQKLNMLDAASQLGAMGTIPSRKKSEIGISARSWYTRRKK